MHIRRVVIENVRRFGPQQGALDIELPPRGWIVVAGRNGAGKTTFLQSIAQALTAQPGLSDQHLSSRWLREGATRARTRLTIVPDADDTFQPEGLTRHWKGPNDAPLEIGDDWSVAHTVMAHGRESQGNRAFAGPWHASPRGWLAAGYGAERRLLGGTTFGTDGTDWNERPAVESAFVTLFHAHAALAHPVRWLQHLDYRSGDEHAPAAERTRAQQLVRLSLDLLNAGLIPDVEVLRVDSSGLRVRQAGVELSLGHMGSGAQVLIALVLDLVRHLGERFGHVRVKGTRDGVQVLHSGVVLIDEAEAHLHVSWQRRLGFWFKAHFPNVQFVVSTHSPFVCQAADEGGLIRLPAPGEHGNAEVITGSDYRTIVHGGVDETVLTRLFGLEHAHSDDAEALRGQVAALEARELHGKLSKREKETLERLRKNLPQTNGALVEATLRRLLAEP